VILFLDFVAGFYFSISVFDFGFQFLFPDFISGIFFGFCF